MNGYIYMITNTVNGKSYIGQTRYDALFRFKQHMTGKTNPVLKRDIERYGAEAFTFEVLEECPWDELDQKEIEYIAKYDTFYTGYNRQRGGHNGREVVISDNKYDEIAGLYKAGFSTHFIASKYHVDKKVISKILVGLGIKLRGGTQKLKLNLQEFLEIKRLYEEEGWTIQKLADRYDCDFKNMQYYLKHRNIKMRERYNIMDDPEAIKNLVEDFKTGEYKVAELLHKYKCCFPTFKKILADNNIEVNERVICFDIEKVKGIMAMYRSGMNMTDITSKYGICKSTVYNIVNRYKDDPTI